MVNKPEMIELHHLFWKKHAHQLPIHAIGPKKYRIKVEKGTVNITHSVYSRDSGCWIDIPKRPHDYQHHYQLTAGTEGLIEFDINHVMNKLDRVFITNGKLFEKAIVHVSEEN
ncbi:hypothetical protein CF160_00950 [Enterococcus pseudoavium]|nr:hypothetical protein CF160_00950 [Enterococcus pseudoavium]